MKRFLLLLVVIGAVVAGAAFSVPSDAARVNGTAISQSTLNSDLSTIASNSGYQCYLNAQLKLASQGQAKPLIFSGVGQNRESGSNGTYATTFVRFWLSQMVDNQLIQQLAAQRRLVITPTDLSTATQELEKRIDNTFTSLNAAGAPSSCAQPGSTIVASLPSSFVNQLAQSQAAGDLLEASAAGVYPITTAGLARYFSAHPGAFDAVCVSDIAAATQAADQALRNQVTSGTPFEQVAKTSSIDASTAPNGGSAGCIPPTSSSYASISRALAGVAIGGLTQPIQAQGGYYFLRLDRHMPIATSDQRTVLLNQGRQGATAALRSATSSSHVVVDPRYGRWNATSIALGVLAPLNPPSTSLLAPTANVPGA